MSSVERHPEPTTGELEDRLDDETIVAHRYRIARFVGNRGFGQVYQAEDSATDVSVSLMRLDREFSRAGVRDRFFATRGSARIDHAGAVDLTDYGEDLDGRLFLVMPWIEQAEALDELLAREHALPWTRARAIFEQIADALRAAHRRGILHGGLEPSRVLIDDRSHAHVLDFGLAPALESAAITNANKPTPRITDTRVLAGKPAYMPPELVRGESPNERSDIYALGLVLWELLAGRPPFTGNPVDTLHSQLHDPLPELVRGDAPVEVEAFLHVALAKDPDDRFASVDELLTTLRALPSSSVVPQLLPRTKTEALGKPSPPPIASPSKPITSAQPAVAALPELPELPSPDSPRASTPAPAPAPARVVEPPSKRRLGLLERAIIGFLLFDLALFGAWKLLGSNSQPDTAEPALASTSANTEPDEVAPAPAPAPPASPAPRVADLPSEPPIAAPTPEPTSLAPTLATLPADELPKQLSEADFRKTMVDARELIATRCLDDQRLRRTLKVAIKVLPSGKVEWSSVLEAPGKTALGKCVSKQTRQVEFPPSREGGSDVYSLRLR